MDEDLDLSCNNGEEEQKTDTRPSLRVELTRLRDTPPTCKLRNTRKHTHIPLPLSSCWCVEPASSGLLHRWPECAQAQSESDSSSHHLYSNLKSPMTAWFWTWIQHTWESATKKNRRWMFFGLGGARDAKAMAHVERENYSWKNLWNQDLHHFARLQIAFILLVF